MFFFSLHSFVIYIFCTFLRFSLISHTRVTVLLNPGYEGVKYMVLLVFLFFLC